MVLVGGIFVLFSKGGTNGKRVENTQTIETSSTKIADKLINKVTNTTVIISETGIPATALNIKNGGTVTFANTTGKSVEVMIVDRSDKEFATVIVPANLKVDSPKFSVNNIYKYSIKGDTTVGFINVTN